MRNEPAEGTRKKPSYETEETRTETAGGDSNCDPDREPEAKAKRQKKGPKTCRKLKEPRNAKLPKLSS